MRFNTIEDFYEALTYKTLIFHDQEPIAFSSFKNDWFEKIHFLNRMETNHLLSNSEINSPEKDQLLAKSGWHDFYWFSNGFLSLEWYRFYLYAGFLESSWNPTNYFSSYNRLLEGRDHRRIISNHLHDNYADKIILSCHSGKDIEKDIFIKTQNKISENLSYTIDTTDFMDSFCHIVTERIYYEDRIHLTEKIFRPIVCCRPFILVSSPHALRYIKDYGFKTFDDFWPERYDGIENHTDRLDEILRVVDYIGSMPRRQMLEMLHSMKEILIYNRRHFYNEFRNIITTELFTNLNRALVADNNQPGYFDKILAELSEEEHLLVQQCKRISDDDIVGPEVLRSSIRILGNKSEIVRPFVVENIGYFANFYAASNYFRSHKRQ